jgi:23S rRNA pseudouridine2605 synthase
LIDDKATAFRAREREELQPTFAQLQRKNANVTMRWFARGKLWESREAERDDFQIQKQTLSAPRERRTDRPEGTERRGADWRPGGAHKDPRDRFKKKNRPERAWSEKDPATQRDRDKPGYVAVRPREPHGDRPWQDKRRADRPWSQRPPDQSDRARPLNKRSDKPSGDARWSKKPSGAGHRPWDGKPRDQRDATQPPWQRPGEPRRPSPRDRSGGGSGFNPSKPRDRKPWSDKPAPPNDRPWQTKPTGPRAQRKPWVGKPSGDAPRADSRSNKSGEGQPRSDRPWTTKPSGPPRGDRPWTPKPSGPPRGDRPWTPKPSGPPRGDRPWTSKPSGPPRGDRPWSGKAPGAGDRKPWQKKPFRPSDPPKPDPRGRSANPRKRRDDEPPDRD